MTDKYDEFDDFDAIEAFEESLVSDDDDPSATPTDPATLARTCFRPIRLATPELREAARIALRIIDDRRWYGELIEHGRIADTDIFALLGVEKVSDVRLTIGVMRELVARQRRRLGEHAPQRSDALQRNIDRLGDLLRLNPCERAILRFAYLTSRVTRFADLFRCTVRSMHRLDAAVMAATGQSWTAVRAALREGSILRRCGFFETEVMELDGGDPLTLSDRMVYELQTAHFDARRFLRRLVRLAPPPTLGLDDYAHVATLATAKRYLAKLGPRARKGVNVLLYGEPGTGKTEWVRAIAAALARTLYEVPNSDGDDDAISGQARFGAYAVCQQILRGQRNQMVLFDEVEDVFGDGGGYGYRSRRRPHYRSGGLRKSWINEMLETNPVPTVWVCNTIDALEPAYVRRFDLVIEMPAPSVAVRRRIIARHFRPGEISDTCVERLANIEHLPPAQVERAARVLRTMRICAPQKRDAEVVRILEGSLRAMDIRLPTRCSPLPDYYDPAFIHCDADLDAIATGLVRTGSARLCLYGPPGTGKTAFAYHLGRLLDRPVVVKRGSDLLGMYVGQTEQRIAEAFRQARDDHAIVLIDEADGFLRDRAGAMRSWEVTQVNELLTQMETFDGVFIASTNLVDTLDAASLRRFDFKLKFDYLDRQQRRALVAKVCGDPTDAGAADALAVLDRLDTITPGDITNALRQCKVTGRAPAVATVVALLAAEQALKPEHRRRQIGFMA